MKLKYSILILFCLQVSYVFSYSTIDSLLIELKTEKNDLNRISLLHEISWEYTYSNIDSAEFYAKKANELINKDLLLHKSFLSFNLGLFGIINDIKGNRSLALYYYQQSLEIKTELKDSIGIASTLTNIGALFYSQNIYTKAFGYFKKSLEIELLLKNYDGIEGSYVNLAIIFKNLNQKDSALHYLNKAALINEITNNQYLNANINANLGALYFENKDFEKAKTYFDKSIAINREIDNKRALVISLDNRAKIYLYQNEVEKAKKCIDEANQLSKAGKFTDTQLKVFETYFEWALLSNDIEQSILYKDSISIYRDSIYNEEINKQINELETKYEVEKNKTLILEQESILLKNQTNFKLLYIGLTFLIVIIIIISILYFYIRKSNTLIKEKNRVIEKAFEERELLIREIHHRVKNNIQSIKSLLSLHKRRTQEESLKQIIENIINRLHSMTFVHEKLYQHDEVFELNIDNYLNDFILSIVESFGLSDSEDLIQIDLSSKNLPIDKMLTVGLLINEIVSNACKYAVVDGVLKLHIKGVVNENDYVLTFQDFGKGITDSDTESFGMELIKLMTTKLQGNIEFINNDNGLLIHLKFPTI